MFSGFFLFVILVFYIHKEPIILSDFDKLYLKNYLDFLNVQISICNF